MLEAIDAVSWGDLPGPDLYEPDRVATGLRALATATGLVRAAGAGSRLAGGGLVHDHSGAVFPSVVVAAPILLAIVRDGHPDAGATALGLLDDALAFATCDRHTRVATPYAGHATPLAVQVALIYPLAEGSPDACLRVDGMDGMGVDEVAPSAVLLPARCGSWGG
ncbi:hypothetical protein [Streptomyces sp. NPDC057718]|uniref:hypothetical protein n=1 Tax=Streptomyces sp. NPDC057718 TaxID=3346225 RepID=UPI0036A2937A